MLTLSQTLGRADGGEPLPTVFTALERRGIRPRRGQVTMIAGQPNAGKSMFALYYALQLGEPTLYFSADSDEATQFERAAAMTTGHKMDDVRDALSNGGGPYYEDELDGLSNFRMDFASNPTLDDIEQTLLAFEEVYGRYPGVIVVDNLINVVAEHDNEKKAFMEIQQVFKYICRETSAAILLLHHCSEADGKPWSPPPRRDRRRESDMTHYMLSVYGDDSVYDMPIEQAQPMYDATAMCAYDFRVSGVGGR